MKSRLHDARFAAVISLVFLLYFRARYGLTIYSNGDDLHYIRWLEKLMGIPTPISIATTDYLPGIAILWLPVGLLSRLLALWIPLDIVLPALVGFSSFLMWVASLAFFLRITQRFNKAYSQVSVNPTWPYLWFFSMPLLYYATNRTTMVHPGEIVVALWMLDSLMTHHPARAAILMLLLASIRVNDGPAILLLGGYFLDTTFPLQWKSLPLGRRVAIASFPLVIALTSIPMLYYGFFHGYNGWTVPMVLKYLTLPKIAHVLFGLDWGLIFTGPMWLVFFGAGFWNWKSLSWTGRAAWGWMLVEFLLCAACRDNGMEFAYRYLLGTYVAAWFVFLDMRKSGKLVRYDRVLNGLLWIAAVWMCYLTWIYKTNVDVTIGWSSQGYGNATLQLQALKQWLHPIQVMRPLFLAPPSVVIYSWFFPQASWAVKYAMSGFPLVFLTMLTIIFIAYALPGTVWQRFYRTSSPGQKRDTAE